MLFKELVDVIHSCLCIYLIKVAAVTLPPQEVSCVVIWDTGWSLVRFTTRHHLSSSHAVANDWLQHYMNALHEIIAAGQTESTGVATLKQWGIFG